MNAFTFCSFTGSSAENHRQTQSPVCQSTDVSDKRNYFLIILYASSCQMRTASAASRDSLICWIFSTCFVAMWPQSCEKESTFSWNSVVLHIKKSHLDIKIFCFSHISLFSFFLTCIGILLLFCYTRFLNVYVRSSICRINDLLHPSAISFSTANCSALVSLL